MLTGNTHRLAVNSTHAYYEQHRWRRLIDDDELERFTDMHPGGGPTTARQWEEKAWGGHPTDAARERGSRIQGRQRPGS